MTERTTEWAVNRLRSFQVSALMDALHRAHEPNDQPGDECSICRPLIAEANDAADAAYLHVARELGWPLPEALR